VGQVKRSLEGVTPGPWEEFIDDSGDRWTGWPLSIEAVGITDKTVVRTGGQWPYEWDAKTSQHEACANARFIAAARDIVPAMADAITALRAENDALHQQAAAAEASINGPIIDLSDADHAALVAHLSPECEPQSPLPNRNSLMMEVVKLRNALAAVQARAEVEPRAWLVRERPGFPWRFTDGDPDRQPNLRGFEVKPLYDRPPAAPTVQDAARVPEIAALIEALKPFADESLFAGPQHDFVTVRRSDCDKARAAIAAVQAPAEVEPVAWQKPDRAEIKRRHAIGSHNDQMRDAQSRCVPCKLCGGKAEITDAGVGFGYWIKCSNSHERAKPECCQSGTRISGWAYNVSDLWNRLNASPPTAPTVQEAARVPDFSDWVCKDCGRNQPWGVARCDCRG